MANCTRRMQGTLLLTTSPAALATAAKVIRRGGLVAFPTETVYGLGADATNQRAVQKIFKAKGRPADNPLIVHLSSVSQLEQVALSVPDQAYLLAEEFWPGPLSLVLPKAPALAENVSAGLSTVAVRMPAHRTALKLIELAGVPLAAPSANLSGSVSPTSYRHVAQDLAGKIEAIIAAGNCRVGIESTVLDLSGAVPLILRPGGVTKEALEAVLHTKVKVATGALKGKPPASPGMKYRHYSPRAPLLLVTGSAVRRQALIKELICYYKSRGSKVGFLSTALTGQGDLSVPKQFAASLYGKMREMDLQKVELIIAEEVQNSGLGLAVMNRLRRAAVRVLRVF